jgi:threonine/homoserine/homoserine lactone efflux protein
MLGIHDLALFVLSGLLLNITPGPDSLYIVGRSASQGWRAGATAAFGVGSGTLVHVLAAAFGLSAILATSAAAFTVVKLLGAGYLLYVGVSLLRSRSSSVAAARGPVQRIAPATLWQIYSQGFLTNLLNPKVALFFLAFVPQFIDPTAPNKPLAFVALGAIFDFNGMLWCNFLAWSAATAGARLKGNARLANILNRMTGCLFVGLGIKLVFARQN